MSSGTPLRNSTLEDATSHQSLFSNRKQILLNKSKTRNELEQEESLSVTKSNECKQDTKLPGLADDPNYRALYIENENEPYTLRSDSKHQLSSPDAKNEEGLPSDFMYLLRDS